MKSAAVVTRVAGQAFAFREGQDVPLQPGSEIFVTDSIRTEGDSKLEMRFHDNSELDLGPRSHVNISDFAFDEAGVPPTFGVHVLQGLTRTASGKIVEQNPDGFSLTTPLGSAGIRGTVIWASVSEKQVIFTVTELGEGHTVVITSADGRTVIIHIPETGVIITEGDTSPLNVFEMTPEQLLEHLRSIFQEDLGATTPQGFYVWGDAEFIASLGNVGTAAGLVPFGHVATLIGALQEFGLEKGAIETALGIVDTGPSTPGTVTPPPVALPPVTTIGSAASDTLLGTAGRDNIISGGSGNDFIVTYDGTAVIEGGYGSRDLIVKMGDITDGTEIFGDERAMNGVTADHDYILIRGEGLASNSATILNVEDAPGQFGVVTMSGGAIYGDGATITNVNTKSGVAAAESVGENGESTIPGWINGDYIQLIGFMTGGTIYGDAHTTTTTVGDLYTGDDNITILQGLDAQGNTTGGVMSGGTIYGDVYTESEAPMEINCGADEIFVHTLTGSGAIYGDAYTLRTSNGAHGGDDFITVNTMSGGTIYGDLHTFDTAHNFYGGADQIDVIGQMSGGTIYGDADSFSGQYITSGSDTITIDSMSGGAVYGDLRQLEVNDSSANSTVAIGGNQIQVTGYMTGGTIYGNAHTIDIQDVEEISSPFNDTIDIGLGLTGTATANTVIYGDAYNIASLNIRDGSSGVSSSFSDTITVNSASNGNGASSYFTIYGDAQYIGDVTIAGNAFYYEFMYDEIEINGDITNATIYGDAESIGSLAWGALGNGALGNAPDSGTWYDPSVDMISPLSDSIVINGTLGSGAVIYGDTKDGTIGSISGTVGDFPVPITADNFGHDFIRVTTLDGGKIHAGFGNDFVTAGIVKNGAVALGSGADTIKVDKFTNGATLNLDFGDDRIKDTLDLRGIEPNFGDNITATVNLYNYGANNIADEILIPTGWTCSATENNQFTISYSADDSTSVLINCNIMADGSMLQI